MGESLKCPVCNKGTIETFEVILSNRQAKFSCGCTNWDCKSSAEVKSHSSADEAIDVWVQRNTKWIPHTWYTKFINEVLGGLPC